MSSKSSRLNVEVAEELDGEDVVEAKNYIGIPSKTAICSLTKDLSWVVGNIAAMEGRLGHLRVEQGRTRGIAAKAALVLRPIDGIGGSLAVQIGYGAWLRSSYWT